ncbi:hypothetical protein ACH5RR_034900 [Cinchona calisaya]|uniref:Cyclin N-terminal domain-containing protein n=1 Tax=Cinchona calisaya TaxID=153742 RepID=A0ABD2YG63_9GENT
MLLRKEINGDGVRKQEEESTYVNRGNWSKDARLNAIQYILNTSLSFGFKIQTAYLAVTYLDKFFFRRLIEEDIISLYNRMKELNMERFELPNIIMSPDLSPIQLQRTTDETENSSLTTTSGIGAKRKRLSFKDEGDENIKMPDSKRPC